MAHCGECKMDFSKTSNLRAHVKRKHPDKLDVIAPIMKNPSGSGSYQCTQCNKCFVNFGSLKFHVRQKHPDKMKELAPRVKQSYECNQCACKFAMLKELRYHRSTNHSVIKTIQCSLCQYTGASVDIVIHHYTQDHCIQIVNETFEFDSFDAFQVWKSKIEAETFASFVQKSGSKKTLEHTKTVFSCHRSGKIRTRGKNMRKMKTQGSNKIGGYCPAKMTVLTKNNECTVKFCNSHVGHGQQSDIGHLFLTNSQRENIASKIAAKIPMQVILDEIRDSFNNCSLGRLHLLTKKDLYNIENSFNLKGSSVHHANDAVSVEVWVDELKTRHSVPFYKPQDSLCEEHPELKSDDFVLIIMTQGQQDLLVKFGTDCICVDGTHGLNGYGFELHTVLILDDLREGYPCAFLISNRSDVAVLKLFFSYIARTIEMRVKPHIFMSDMAEAYYNAWIEIMLPAEFRLFCAWHVDRAWRKNLDKIANKEKKAVVYQMLRMLLQERDVISFQGLLQKFLLYCKESSDTLEFAHYFEVNYVSKSEQWAYCYRINSGLNTNMHIERMHRTIKHIYLNGKFVKRLDKAIGAIMKFVRDRLYERLIVLHKGKVCTKLSILRQRHKNSECLDLSTVVQNDNMTWLVSSASRKEVYEVTEIKSGCSCMLICDECNACIHRYSCTCLDCSIQWNMCKHIHLVCKFIQQLPNSGNGEVHDFSSENNLVIDLNEKHDEISGLVKALSTAKPVDNVQQNLEEKRNKLLKIVQEELLHATTIEKIEAAEKIIAALKPTLAAVENQQQLFTSLPSLPSSSNTPHNRKIQPQRRLFATKQPRKKKTTLKKPSAEEVDVLAVQLLHRE